MSTWRAHNRRAALRVPLFGVQLSWTPVLKQRRFRPKGPPGVATVLDLSLNGARVRAQYDSRISVGTQVLVAAHGGTGIAEVRRINSETDLHGAFYGIQFVFLDPPLFQLFNDTLAERRSQSDQ